MPATGWTTSSSRSSVSRSSPPPPSLSPRSPRRLRSRNRRPRLPRARRRRRRRRRCRCGWRCRRVGVVAALFCRRCRCWRCRRGSGRRGWRRRHGSAVAVGSPPCWSPPSACRPTSRARSPWSALGRFGLRGPLALGRSPWLVRLSLLRASCVAAAGAPASRRRLRRSRRGGAVLLAPLLAAPPVLGGVRSVGAARCGRFGGGRLARRSACAVRRPLDSPRCSRMAAISSLLRMPEAPLTPTCPAERPQVGQHHGGQRRSRPVTRGHVGRRGGLRGAAASTGAPAAAAVWSEFTGFGSCDVLAAAASRDEVRISHGFPFFPSLIESREGSVHSADPLNANGPTVASATVIAGFAGMTANRHPREELE